MRQKRPYVPLSGLLGVSCLLCKDGSPLSVATICNGDIAEDCEPRNSSDLVKERKGV